MFTMFKIRRKFMISALSVLVCTVMLNGLGVAGHALTRVKTDVEKYKIFRTKEQTNYVGEISNESPYKGDYELKILKTAEGREIFFKIELLVDCGEDAGEVEVIRYVSSKTISAPLSFNEDCVHIVFTDGHRFSTETEYLWCENDDRITLFNIDVDSNPDMPNRLVFDKDKDREDKRTVGMSN